MVWDLRFGILVYGSECRGYGSSLGGREGEVIVDVRILG